MKTLLFFPLGLLLSAAAVMAQPMAPTVSPANTTALPASSPTGRLTYAFDANWLFHRGPVAPEGWTLLNLPHDWSIVGPFSAEADTKRGGAYLPAGTGHYRRFFTLPTADSGLRTEIQFDGIQANGEVIINGHSLGSRPYGYVGVNYDLTPYLTYGPDKPNTLEVNVDNSLQPLSRYYTGSGIERHVRLVVTNPVHLETWGLYVTTKDIVSLDLAKGAMGQSATLHVQTVVTNSSNAPHTVTVTPTATGPDGQSVTLTSLNDAHERAGHDLIPPSPQTIAAGQTATFAQDVVLDSPRLWDPRHPNLYSLTATVTEDSHPLDTDRTTIGIRQAEFKPATGFWLNGENLKILGVCLHEEGGAIGEAVPRSVYVARFAAMKSLGVNAIRFAHNPPNPVELDVCDQLGLLVMDEMFDCWTTAKPNAEKGYSMFFNTWSLPDLRDTVRRDRNHPSIVLWSTGNEIHDSSNNQKTRDILKGLVAAFHATDPSRPVTQALLQPDKNNDYSNGYADTLDVIGSNYRDSYMVNSQQAVPTRKLINTEEHEDVATWAFLRDHPSLAGCFLWDGIDYLGEGFVPKVRGVDDPPGAWPNISSGSGLVDRTLAIKGNGYQRESWWSDQPVVRLVRTGDRPTEVGAGGDTPPPSVKLVDDWSPQTNYPQATVQVFSNCQEVELFLNDRSLGVKSLPANASPREWRLAYAPGTLRAVGRNAGQEAAHDELRTAGAPAKIALVADHSTATPDFDDVVFVRATVTDVAGVRIPDWATTVSFQISGPGVILATDNGKLNDTTPFPQPTRTVKDGRLLALIRASAAAGQIIITATAPGLASGTVTLTATPPK